MKDIKTYIKESSDYRIYNPDNVESIFIQLLNKYNYKLKNTTFGKTKNERLYNSEKQEKEIVDYINSIGKSFAYDVIAYTSEDWAKNNNETYNSKYNLENGDIVLTSNYKSPIFIDLKVAYENNNTFGPINALSLYSFANTEDHYYLCINTNNNKCIGVRGKDIYNLFNSNDNYVFHATQSHERKQSKNINIWLDKLGTDCDNILDDDDYIYTNVTKRVSL